MDVKLCLVKFWCLFFSINGVAQSSGSYLQNTSCGVAISITGQQRTEYADAFLKWKSKRDHSNKNNRVQSVLYTIPIVFHLIEGTSSITDNQISQAVASLNSVYSHAGAFAGGPGVDTEIQFCLAQRAPDGSKTSGITRVASDYEQMDMDLENAKLKTMGQWDPRHYMNVWVVKNINSEIIRFYTGRDWWTRSGAGGYATLPGGVISSQNYSDGIVVAGLSPVLLAHEAGHYLGLLHTFNGGCKNDDCFIDGDMVCDTPPDNSTRNSCLDNSCKTDTLSNFSNNTFFNDVPDMGSNIMDYGGCPNDFSTGQSERMQFHLDQFRVNLYLESAGSNSICTPPCSANISVSFTQNNLHPIPTTLVNFTSIVNGADTFAWYVEYLGSTSDDYPVVLETGYVPSTPVVSATQGLTYSFPTAGKYRVYLKVWDSGNPTCFASSSKIVKVTCGVDARFWPDKRLIAAKRPKALFLEPVTFTNRSTGATNYKWTITHSNPIAGVPNLPDFTSVDESLTYAFPEPGNYSISLKAINGACENISNTFLLKVLDPTMDGSPLIKKVECSGIDSLRVEFRLFNYGYDTINTGTPVSFYDKDPATSVSQITLLTTYLIPEIVYGFDSTDYVVFMKNTNPPLQKLFVVFNNTGSVSFPITFPKADKDIMSFNSSFPPSGYAELTYDNNFDSRDVDPQVQESFSDQLACLGATLTFAPTIAWKSVTWTSQLQGSLGTSNSLQYTVSGEDAIRVILVSEFGCRYEDSFLIRLSTPDIVVAQEEYRIARGQSVQLGVLGGVSYSWSPIESLDDPTSASPKASPRTSTVYTIEVTNAEGCKGTAQISVIVETSAYIPDLFTPNNDSKNDILLIYELEDVENIQFQIFNRSGGLVYESSNSGELSSRGWDGSWQGKDQPNGVFFWKVSGRYRNGKDLVLNGKRSGSVNLMR